MNVAYNMLVGKLKGRDPLEDIGVDDNIRIDLGEIRWEGADWFHLAQNRDQWPSHVNTVMNLWVP